MVAPFGLGSRRGICVYHRRCGTTSSARRERPLVHIRTRICAGDPVPLKPATLLPSSATICRSGILKGVGRGITGLCGLVTLGRNGCNGCNAFGGAARGVLFGIEVSSETRRPRTGRVERWERPWLLNTARRSRSSITPMLGGVPAQKPLQPLQPLHERSLASARQPGRRWPAVPPTRLRRGLRRREAFPARLRLPRARTDSAQLDSRAAICSPLGPLMRRRQGATGSLDARRCMRTTTERDMIVSGRSSNPASATAQ